MFAAAAQIATAENLDDETKRTELEALVDHARAAGIDLTVQDLTAWLNEHDPEVPAYSWVHLNDFRLFEPQDRCYPWTTEDELLAETDTLSGPSRPRWERS